MNDIKLVDRVEKLDYIDVVRGIAILLVIVVHMSQSTDGISQLAANISQYGRIGVQLFFLASAYTLCFSKVKRVKQKKPLISFFIRRFFRIAPLYYFAIVLYFLLEPYTHILARIKVSYSLYDFKSITANIMFVHGFVPSANNNIVPGGWSIGTEMAFYLLFPILFYIFDRSYKSYGILSLYALVGVSVCLNILVQLFVHRLFSIAIDNNLFIYYNLVNQLPVFLCGMTIFFHHHYKISLPFPIPAQILCFIALTIVGIIIMPSRPYWLVAALIPVFAGISFIFLLNIFRELKYSNTFLAAIGQVSYSIYIFHFLFVWYLVPEIGLTLKKAILPEILFIFAVILATGLTFLTAKISEKYIEHPGILLGKVLISKL